MGSAVRTVVDIKADPRFIFRGNKKVQYKEYRKTDCDSGKKQKKQLAYKQPQDAPAVLSGVWFSFMSYNYPLKSVIRIVFSESRDRIAAGTADAFHKRQLKHLAVDLPALLQTS